MKTTIVQEISEIEHKDESCTEETASNQQRDEDYPKNIENYYLLLRALYENSSTSLQSSQSEESFKENNINNKNIDVKVKRKSNEEESVVLVAKINQQQLVTSSSMHYDAMRCKSEARAEESCPRAHENPPEKVPDDASDNYRALTPKRDDKNYRYDESIRHTTCSNGMPSKHTDGESDSNSHYHTTASIDSSQRTHLTGDIKPITSTYLLMTRSMGMTDEDALNLVSARGLPLFAGLLCVHVCVIVTRRCSF
jgi:hypothetical protein